MFGSDKSSSSKRLSNSDQSNMPLLGGDKKNDDKQSERLFVKIKSGDTTEIEVDISETETVDDLKKKLINLLQITGKRVRLIASGRMLEPGNKYLTTDFKVKSGAFIHVVVSENVVNPTSSGSASLLGVPNATIYRGLDQLNAAGMSADEIAAVRSSFITSIDRFCAEQNLVRTEEETLITFRFRVEEMWMDTQDLASEFYMNLPPAAARLRASRIAVQGGFTGGPPPGPEGAHLLSNMNPNGTMNVFNLSALQMSRSVSGSGSGSDYHMSDEEASVGTQRDFIWGVIMGYFLGGIMLFCLWHRNYSHKSKVGILLGVTLQLLIIQGTGEPQSSSGVPTMTNPSSSTGQPGGFAGIPDLVGSGGQALSNMTTAVISATTAPSHSPVHLPSALSLSLSTATTTSTFSSFPSSSSSSSNFSSPSSSSLAAVSLLNTALTILFPKFIAIFLSTYSPKPSTSTSTSSTSTSTSTSTQTFYEKYLPLNIIKPSYNFLTKTWHKYFVTTENVRTDTDSYVFKSSHGHLRGTGTF